MCGWSLALTTPSTSSDDTPTPMPKITAIPRARALSFIGKPILSGVTAVGTLDSSYTFAPYPGVRFAVGRCDEGSMVQLWACAWSGNGLECSPVAALDRTGTMLNDAGTKIAITGECVCLKFKCLLSDKREDYHYLVALNVIYNCHYRLLAITITPVSHKYIPGRLCHLFLHRYTTSTSIDNIFTSTHHHHHHQLPETRRHHSQARCPSPWPNQGSWQCNMTP